MRFSSFLLAALLSVNAYAADEATPAAVSATLNQLKASGNLDSYEVKPAAIAGLYEILVDNSEVLYISADGQHLLVSGDLLALGEEGFKNLTDMRRNEARQSMVAAIKDEDTVVFPAKGETKYVLNVFTDVDCFYCVKLHQEVDKLNEAGVKVRYLAFPRAGIGSETYKNMVSVWCAENQQEAMTAAKNRKPVKPATCANPIKNQYELAQKMGVRGTPALLFSNGQLTPGYVPAPQLIEALIKADQ
jgi:thiol:disulfide interchange protein DsbC